MKRTRAFLAIALAAVALVAPLPQAAAHPPGAFAVQCGRVKIAMQDPIVYPGQRGVGHMHAFYGNKSINPDSTYRSLVRANTTCTDPKDRVAVWVPVATLKKRSGKVVDVTATRERTYYFPSLRPGKDGKLYTIPKNLKLIAGNPMATSPSENPDVRWYCGEGSPERPYPYDCSPYTSTREDGVRAIVDFPFCWDGVNTDSADHRSHVIYPNPKDTTPHERPASCPTDHPKNIPSISVRVHFALKDPCAGATPCGPDSGGKKVRLRLASGPYWTMHADFWNTWVQRRLDALVTKCLVHQKECGILGVPGT